MVSLWDAVIILPANTQKEFSESCQYRLGGTDEKKNIFADYGNQYDSINNSMPKYGA